jgi:hypothetical protein
MKKDILQKVLSGLSDQNIRFADLQNLLLSFEFEERIKGDHHIYSRSGIVEIINLQSLRNGKAKPYRNVLTLCSMPHALCYRED